MNLTELRQIIVSAGLSCREQRQEIVLEVCHFCGNDRFNLGCSPDKGVYYCWACQKGGRLSELLRSLTGQDHHIPVQKREKAQPKAPTPAAAIEFQSESVVNVGSAAAYLLKRGISPIVAEQFGLRVCTDSKHRLYARIAFPMKDFWTGETLGWIGRSYTGKQPKYLSTLTRKVITGWRMRDKATPVVLVEGPMDGLTTHLAGFQVGVLSGVGSGDLKGWASRIPMKTPVVIMLDGEAATEAQKLYWQIFPILWGRVGVVKLPQGQDPSNIGVEGVKVALHEALRGLSLTSS